ncbi:SnoaL-like domain protein [Symmachiella macrocystis]|uniref:SnoaL-like domain protein n=1 Tax=Symmachiella macrocystis TaxID=2527985 RepID=A0A5C6B570_9PLAN|nr:nuclear transport factor 2 family protein [Symmachiella macrocystis]TWU06897.1 SnoaL-like domain protein [Symmachiella macrocystis]
MLPPALESWIMISHSKNTEDLADLLADDVVFYSPIVHTAQSGKAATLLYLTAASKVFFNETFTYVKQSVSESAAFLEFTTEIDNIFVNGVDIISWNAEGKICEFKVMIRPLKAINVVHQMMGQMLERMRDASG